MATKEGHPMRHTGPEKHPSMIELPRAKEVVTSVFYNIRVDCEEAARVDVAIDGSVWQPCRFDGERWSYDWSDYLPGRHKLRAQSYDADGVVLAFESREVVVHYELAVH